MNKLVLIGASLGSLLAFEMASQLGVETEMIVIDGTSNQRPVTSLHLMTQCTHSLQTLSISLEEHRSMMIDILNKYKVDDPVLIDHMISHSWQLYLLSRDYHPIRNERISVRQEKRLRSLLFNHQVHVFSCCETDLNWSEIALLKVSILSFSNGVKNKMGLLQSVHKLTGDHSQILNLSNSTVLADYIPSLLCHPCAHL